MYTAFEKGIGLRRTPRRHCFNRLIVLSREPLVLSPADPEAQQTKAGTEAVRAAVEEDGDLTPTQSEFDDDDMWPDQTGSEPDDPGELNQRQPNAHADPNPASSLVPSPIELYSEVAVRTRRGDRLYAICKGQWSHNVITLETALEIGALLWPELPYARAVRFVEVFRPQYFTFLRVNPLIGRHQPTWEPFKVWSRSMPKTGVGIFMKTGVIPPRPRQSYGSFGTGNGVLGSASRLAPEDGRDATMTDCSYAPPDTVSDAGTNASHGGPFRGQDHLPAPIALPTRPAARIVVHVPDTASSAPTDAGDSLLAGEPATPSTPPTSKYCECCRIKCLVKKKKGLGK